MESAPRHAKIDIHLHLAGNGCCASGCWIGPRFRDRLSFRLLQRLYGVNQARMDSDADQYWARLVHEVVAASPLDYGVVLGFDGVYAPSNGAWIEADSQMLIPPSWVFAVCRQYPNLLPGPSIHPCRSDALDQLELCIEGGAVLIKWLPSAQAIDPAAPLLGKFYRRLAEAGIPLLVHTGGERTFAEISPGVNEVRRLVPALEAGVTVICAHSATPIIASGERNQLAELEEFLQRYPRLFVDNSGMNNPGRWHNLHRLAASELIQSRTLYGSDWPVPANAFYHLGKFGPREVVRLERISNLLDRDIAIKMRAGFRPEMLTRANSVLANLERWRRAAPPLV